MEFSPGKWSEKLIERANARAVGTKQSLGNFGPELAAEMMAKAQEWVSSFTVVIGTTGIGRNRRQVRSMAPATGVIVRLHGDMYGVLTAGHVLRRGDNTSKSAGVTVLAPPKDQNQRRNVTGIKLGSRPCTVVGFYNETEDGPDIAIIPLAITEWRNIEGLGMVAYNLDKERWSDEDTAGLRELKPWLISIINGVRFEASEIVYRHSEGKRESLAIVASNTRVEVARERDGYDYLELPSETTEYSYPTHWKNGLPGTAAEEIEEFHDKGVTRPVWGGISGAGVWNLAIGTNDSGLPDGKVLAELAGICFYANSKKGCIIAHGSKSIKKISASHVEREALRYHSMT